MRPPYIRFAQAELFHGHILGVKLADDFALVHDENAVGDVHDLVELQRHEQNALASVALGDELLVDVFDRAHVEASRRLHGHKKFRVLIDFARDDCLLLVAAGHAAHHRTGTLARAHVVLLDEAVGIRPDGGEVDKAVFLELRLPVALEDHVLLERKIED